MTYEAETKKEKISIGLWLSIVLSWFFYLPLAYFLLAISVMAGDSGSISIGVGAAVLIINFLPFFIMIFMTRKSVIKKSKILAISPVPSMIIFVSIISSLAGNIVSMSDKADLSRNLKKVSTPTKTHFVCSEHLAVDLHDDKIDVIEVKISSKGRGGIHTSPIHIIKDGKIFSTDFYTFRNPDEQAFYDKTLRECKNSEGKTVLDLFDFVQ